MSDEPGEDTAGDGRRGDTPTVSLADGVAVAVGALGLGVVAPGFPVPVAAGWPELALVERWAHRGAVDPELLAAEVARESAAELGPLRALAHRLAAIAHDGASVAPAPTEMVGPPASIADWPSDALFLLRTPLVLRAGPAGFEVRDHDGHVVVTLDAPTLVAVSALHRLSSLDDIDALQQDALGAQALPRASLDAAVAGLVALGLVVWVAPDDLADSELGGAQESMRQGIMSRWTIQQRVRDELAARDAQDRCQPSGAPLVPVHPITFNDNTPPLALGLIMAYAGVHDGGRLAQHYDLRPHWLVDERDLDAMVERPGVFLFSNYVWSLPQCLAFSAKVKERSPHSVTIHGGPSTPKYEADARAFFLDHPHVDVIVRGEGELTTAEVLRCLIGSVGDGPVDLEVLRDVPGLSYRGAEGVVRTPDRERMSDLDVIPSPYLEGMFDAFVGLPGVNAVLETNRGCPYGCTFCDWGSATLSRIRKFDLDRVLGELAWCARSAVVAVGPADANFGIFERDVTIAERVAELHRETGFPKFFGANYAKNTVKHLRRIISVLADAGVMTSGILSLQSMDEDTLSAIERSNIKLEKYEELAGEFRRAGLPLFVDLMVGLPGQTRESFRVDLQECIDREVHMRVPVTVLLANSPMNDPAYRDRWQIAVDDRALVVSTSTFSRDEYHEMMDLRRVVLLGENFGVFRHVTRYVRQETGITETDLYERWRTAVRRDPGRWPYLAMTLGVGPELMAPPVSWRLLVDDLRGYLVTELGVVDDDALGTVLAVQHALLPSRGRRFPLRLELPHDYVAWYRQVIDRRDTAARSTWTVDVPHLRSHGPGVLVVDDPDGIADSGVGVPLESHGFGVHWELDSPLARSVVGHGVPRQVTPA